MSKRFAFLATLLVLSTSNFAFADPIALFSSFGPGDSFRLAAIPILGPGYPLSEGDVSLASRSVSRSVSRAEPLRSRASISRCRRCLFLGIAVR